MEDRIYRLTEVVGTSSEGVDQAIKNAIARASRTVRHLDWFVVSEVRGVIADGDVAQYQVTLRLGFRLED